MTNCPHPYGEEYWQPDPNTGRLWRGCRRCGCLVAPARPEDAEGLACQGDLTMRPRPCGCVGSEQSCAACIEAASLSELNKRAAERGKAWRFDCADNRLRAQQGGMTLRWFANTADAWQWEALQ